MSQLAHRRVWRPALAMATAAALLLTACGGDDDEPTTTATSSGPAATSSSSSSATDSAAATSSSAAATSETSAPAASGEKVTLTWWDYFGYAPGPDAAMNDMIKRYQDANPNVTIKRTAIAYPDFETKVKQAVATKTLPDIMSADAGVIPSYAAQGAWADISDKVKDFAAMKEFFPAVAEQVVVDGKTYGVPFRSNALVLWYNEDQFKEAGVAGPPKNWEELNAAAGKLATNNRSAICFPANKTESATFVYLSHLWQAGGDIQTIGDQPSVQALEQIGNLVKKNYAPKSIINWTWDDATSGFVSGNCSMLITGPWNLGNVEKASFKWNVANLPAGPSGKTASPIGGEAWTIGANSKHVDEAWKLVEWLSTTENTATNILKGLQSLPNRNDQVGHPDANWSPIVPVVSEGIKTGKTRAAYGPKYNEISGIIQTMLQQVLTGTDAKKAAEDAGKKIKPLLPQG